MKKKILQKTIFLKGEGDKWLFRNKKIDKKKFNRFKNIIKYFNKVLKKFKKKKVNILEVGSSNGNFLDIIGKRFKNCILYGIDPSKKAIKELNKKNILGKVATADNLPFKKNSMDIIYYGFCLYLCDEIDYKKIFLNAKRVLKKNGYLIIYDFYSENFIKKKYKHHSGIFSHKMDFRNIFSRQKKFTSISHKKFEYDTGKPFNKNNKKDLVAISVMRKLH